MQAPTLIPTLTSADISWALEMADIPFLLKKKLKNNP